MRGFLILIISIFAVYASFFSYFIAFAFYSWFDLLKVQNIIWGSFGDIPYSMCFFFAGLWGYFISRQKLIFKLNIPYVALILFMIHISLAHYLSDVPIQVSGWKYESSIKNLIFVAVCCLLIRTRAQAEAVISVFVLALGYYIASKSWQTIQGSGGYNNYGVSEAQSILGETSTYTIAIYGGSAYLWYLGRYSILMSDRMKKFLRIAWPIYSMMGLVGAVGTESRSGLIVFILLVPYLFLKAKRKFLILSLLFLAAVSVPFFAPESWKERMNTVLNYEEDSSAMGRINAWKFAILYASDHPIFGGGYGVVFFNPDRTEAHSIYFEVLGEQGYLGLFYYLVIIYGAYWLNFKVTRKVSNMKEYEWIQKLCFANAIAMVSFFVGGAFLNLSRNYLFYLTFIVVIFLYSYVTVCLKENGDSKRSLLRSKV